VLLPLPRTISGRKVNSRTAGTLRFVRVMSGIVRLLVATLLAGVLVAGLMLPYFLGVGLASNQVTSAIADVQSDDFNDPVPQRTTITDAKGNTITTLYDQNRVIVPLSQINDLLIKAVISMEDRRFYKHHGVDWAGTIRALLRNTSSGATQSGGSTITQQYVKNYLFLVKAKTDAQKADAIAQTPIRKLREAKMALQLEQKLSKEDILFRYLNLVAFGPSTYGAEAASMRFFGIHASDLQLPQAAMLAAMINNPNKYNPINPDRPQGFYETMVRRNQVLDKMVASNAISRATADKAKNAPAMLKPTLTPNGCIDARGSSTNGYYCQYVLDYLANKGLDGGKLATGGYTIRTNLDPASMTDAKSAVDANADPSSDKTKRIANVMAIVQPGQSTRKVTALTSNRPYGLTAAKGQTVQRLPTTFAPLGAGSTFKIFTAAAALDLGLGTQEPQLGVPPEYYSPLAPSHKFSNSGSFPPKLTLQRALATSPNTTFVQLEDNIGLDKVTQMAVKLGLRGYSLDAGQVSPQFSGAGQSYADEVVRQKIASFTLGVSPVSPLELSNVGATLASEGMWCPPSPVDTITQGPDARIVDLPTQACEQVVKPELARTLAQAMKGDLTDPDGTSHKSVVQAGWTRIAAGKTGTTQDYKSSAYLGFTPQYSGAVLVWDYLPKPQSICRLPLRSCSNNEAQGGNGMSGGSVPAQTWLGAMKPLHAGLPEQDFNLADPSYLQGQPQNQIPQVQGQPVDQARAAVEAKGFSVKVVSSDKSGAAANVVIGVSPSDVALPGTQVTLTIATGGTTTGG